MNHYYLPHITMNSAVERMMAHDKERGLDYILHTHSAGEECTERCTIVKADRG